MYMYLIYLFRQAVFCFPKTLMLHLTLSSNSRIELRGMSPCLPESRSSSPPMAPGGGKTYPLLRPVRVRPPSVQVSLIVQMNKLGMRYIAGEAQITPKWLPFGYHQLGYQHIIHERKVLWGRVWFDILEWLLIKCTNNLILWLPW